MREIIEGHVENAQTSVAAAEQHESRRIAHRAPLDPLL